MANNKQVKHKHKTMQTILMNTITPTTYNKDKTTNNNDLKITTMNILTKQYGTISLLLKGKSNESAGPHEG